MVKHNGHQVNQKIMEKLQNTHKNLSGKYVQSVIQTLPEISKNPKLKFIFIKHNRFSLMEKFWPPSLYWTYAKWQKKAFKIVEQLNKKEKIDLCHQLNMIGIREPGYLWRLNIPFV